jgi:hypothetical protein
MFNNLQRFIDVVEDEQKRSEFAPATVYFNASRAASNDAGPRQTRINTMLEILPGHIPAP